MDNESDFDFSKLTTEQLKHAIDNIDGSKFPRNLAGARAALRARAAGQSPEPVPVIDRIAEERFTKGIWKLFALILLACAVLGIIVDDLWIPYWSQRGFQVLHLRGVAAWVGGLSVGVFALVPFLGGVSETDGISARPRFTFISVVAIVLFVVAVAIGLHDGSA